MGSDDWDEIMDEAKSQDEKMFDIQADDADKKNERELIKQFSDNPEALAAYYEIDRTNIEIHDRLMDEQEKALDLIDDCTAIPENLRELFWESLSNIETYSRDADLDIKNFVESLIEDADTGNPDFAPLFETLRNMYFYARLKK